MLDIWHFYNTILSHIIDRWQFTYHNFFFVETCNLKKNNRSQVHFLTEKNKMYWLHITFFFLLKYVYIYIFYAHLLYFVVICAGGVASPSSGLCVLTNLVTTSPSSSLPSSGTTASFKIIYAAHGHALHSCCLASAAQRNPTTFSRRRQRVPHRAAGRLSPTIFFSAHTKIMRTTVKWWSGICACAIWSIVLLRRGTMLL